jgi:hypothetical protein
VLHCNPLRGFYGSTHNYFIQSAKEIVFSIKSKVDDQMRLDDVPIASARGEQGQAIGLGKRQSS